mmetsp:Transcript_13171/g.38247  ORF Transcript_13171/g.38247 Transcript_13171/m.38247 type:complete len:205 (-) Transcript_13171:384-998(-)
MMNPRNARSTMRNLLISAAETPCGGWVSGEVMPDWNWSPKREGKRPIPGESIPAGIPCSPLPWPRCASSCCRTNSSCCRRLACKFASRALSRASSFSLSCSTACSKVARRESHGDPGSPSARCLLQRPTGESPESARTETRAPCCTMFCARLWRPNRTRISKGVFPSPSRTFKSAPASMKAWRPDKVSRSLCAACSSWVPTRAL